MIERIAYSVTEFAAATGLAEGTVRAGIKRGDIEIKKVGRRILIPVSVVKLFSGRDNGN